MNPKLTTDENETKNKLTSLMEAYFQKRAPEYVHAMWETRRDLKQLLQYAKELSRSHPEDNGAAYLHAEIFELLVTHAKRELALRNIPGAKVYYINARTPQ